MGKRRSSPLLPLLFLLLLAAVLVATAAKTYYEILGLDRDASLNDVKKAYRKLAMEFHPDRNKGREDEATLKFREVGEAYEVLSDEGRRRHYDAMLRSGGGAGARGARFDFGGRQGGRPRDAFSQFNDLFKNDPFFADAFKNMDDLFSKTFEQGGGGGGGGGSGKRKGFGEWVGGKLLDSFGGNINIQMNSNVNGRRSSSSFNRNSGRRSGGGATYTSRSTRTTIENGKRITIQSLEKDGNRIEEKFDGETLIERRINGALQKDVGRIGEF